MSNSDDQRQSLLKTTKRLEDGSTVLENAHKEVLATIEVGQNTMVELERQEERLRHISDRVRAISDQKC